MNSEAKIERGAITRAGAIIGMNTVHIINTVFGMYKAIHVDFF